MNIVAYQKYGFSKDSVANRKGGDPITYIFYNPDGTVFKSDNYYLSPQTYQETFKEAGFIDFK